TEAGKAKQTRAFWQTVTEILSEYAGGARVELTYKGLSESGTLDAGAAGTDGETFLTDYHDAEGRHVSARFEGLRAGFPGERARWVWCATCARKRRSRSRSRSWSCSTSPRWRPISRAGSSCRRR